ncbi:FeoC-like transcriptional regulator [Clostridium sp. Cult2]|uniref:FeoC-like transcriptional regulator n=1 Tax=Clostridium sp. Cult2 TaxID=2079003 RepID=UPI001F2278C2|nr:FeoC-like transcriptional regulator [Clostridium sp. Cult2]MCF6466570.1 hypothetical protein [Clostridium sp. Cult2]
MLKEVLFEINNSNYISKSNIASKLNKNENLIEDAFSQLIRMGYIKENDRNSCNSQCTGCSFASLCNKNTVKTVIITEKGEKLLNK